MPRRNKKKKNSPYTDILYLAGVFGILLFAMIMVASGCRDRDRFRTDLRECELNADRSKIVCPWGEYENGS